MRFLSPLRYPGGKAALGPFIGRLIAATYPRPTTYVEPFAGGAGVALRLLFDEYVERVAINDLDRGVFSFWQAVFFHTDDLVRRIDSCDVSIDTWRQQRLIRMKNSGDEVELGFATFFLNRTNRSGILDARPIGGLGQAGKWRLDVRFNKKSLIQRIQLIARYRNRVTVSRTDGRELISDLRYGANEIFIYADPPYIDKGADLYLDNLSWEDHRSLAEVLSQRSGPWMVTYDANERAMKELYPAQRCGEYGISHTAGKQRVGKELVFFSNELNVEDEISIGSGSFRWLKETSAAT